MDQPDATDGGGSGLAVKVAMVAAFVVIVGYFALGMPGMDHSAGTMTDAEHQGMSRPVRLSPVAFQKRMDSSDVFTVNVHVPVGGGIAGTDATVAYDAIVEDERLAARRGGPILLYCETGRMAETAAAALLESGYSDVSILDGGLRAWREARLPWAD